MKRRRHQRAVSLFGERSKKNTKNTEKTKNEKSTFKRLVYVLFICIFVSLIACLGIGTGMYAAIVQEISDMNVHDLALTRSSVVYYNDEYGNSREAATLFSDGNSIWLESNEIADIMKQAIVSIEDERFYSHNGIDIKRSGGAIIGYIHEKIGGAPVSYGGSTITQQVIKNITQEKDRTAARKIKEMMRAVAIEHELSKDEILTLYLNVIFLANNCYGVEAASNLYFGKSASDLTLTEAAMIAGITQRPSYFDPLKNPDNALKKRNTVLKKMYDLKVINEEEYNAAVESDLGLHETHTSYSRKVYSYFVDAVINDVIKDLQTEKGYTETFATQQVFSGGLKIYTTMDIKIQDAIESILETRTGFPSGAASAQAAMIIIDPSNGEIKGIVGGAGEKTDSRGLNRATQSRRQPGSSIKPLSVYSPAIEKGLITPSTLIKDEPMYVASKDWSPKNSYSGYKGTITIKKAVEISANIPAIKILQQLGLDTSYNYVKNKFRLELAPEDKDLSPLALGGLTKGVTAKEMAAAYSVFANGGIYNEPHTYTKVLDSANRVLLEKNPVKEQIISEATAYTMSQLLYNVVNGSAGTGRAAKLSNMPTYGKTGTTNNNNDNWFVCYTPYYTGAVWFGYDTQQRINDSNVSARIWNRVMEKVHDGLDQKELIGTENLVSAYVCSVTGLLATQNCRGVTEYYISGTEPKKYCSANHYTRVTDDNTESEDGSAENGQQDGLENQNEGQETVTDNNTTVTIPEPDNTGDGSPTEISDDAITLE